VGKTDGIADGLSVTRDTTLGGIDDAGDDDPKSKPLGSLEGACVGSLLGLFDGVPDGTMLCTKLGVADGPVVGTADVAKVRFCDRFVGGLGARLRIAHATRLYATAGTLLALDRPILSRPLTTILDLPTTGLEAWISQAEPTIHRCITNAIAIYVQTNTLDGYFPRLRAG
jgi:hypothetical protein